MRKRFKSLPSRELKKLHFEVVSLKTNQIFQAITESDELVCVISSGHLQISFAEIVADLHRKNPFEDLPSGIYLPPFNEVKIENVGNQEGFFYIARAEVPKGVQLVDDPVLIKPEDIKTFSRGKDSYFRTIRNIVDKDFPAYTLLCGETINPPGNWSSFPPHKHDSSYFDDESEHEEVYFHLFSPSEGWG